MVTIIKETKGGILMIRLLRKQGTNKEESDLHTKVAMKTIVPYLMLKIGFSLLRGTRKTLGGLTP